jgi:hypothetical protein
MAICQFDVTKALETMRGGALGKLTSPVELMLKHLVTKGGHAKGDLKVHFETHLGTRFNPEDGYCVLEEIETFLEGNSLQHFSLPEVAILLAADAPLMIGKGDIVILVDPITAEVLYEAERGAAKEGEKDRVKKAGQLAIVISQIEEKRTIGLYRDFQQWKVDGYVFIFTNNQEG